MFHFAFLVLVSLSGFLQTVLLVDVTFQTVEVEDSCMLKINYARIKKYNRTAYALEAKIGLPFDITEEMNLRVAFREYSFRTLSGLNNSISRLPWTAIIVEWAISST